jgi:hypothetical protein
MLTFFRCRLLDINKVGREFIFYWGFPIVLNPLSDFGMMLTGGAGGFLFFDFVLRPRFWINPPLPGDYWFDDVGGLFYSAGIFDG